MAQMMNSVMGFLVAGEDLLFEECKVIRNPVLFSEPYVRMRGILD